MRSYETEAKWAGAGPREGALSRRGVLQGGVAALAASAAGCGETARRGPKAPGGGLSQERLGRLHDAMAAHVEGGQVPGLVMLIGRQGEVHVDAMGSMASGGGGPMRRDTIFRVASLTKPIAAAAAMALVEEGKLALSEPVDRLLPELSNRKVLARIDGPLDDTVPAKRPILVSDLLTFRMGFGIIFDDPAKYPIMQALEKQIPNHGMPSPLGLPAPNEWLRRFATLPLMHQPGERWMYNTAADVLGILVERASGRPFEAYLRERIFGPLGMKDTGFSVPAAKFDRLSTSYLADPETGALSLYDAPPGHWGEPPAFASGGAGLVSTVDDYLLFAQMLMNRGALGGERVLSEGSVAAMTADQLTPEQKAASASSLTPDYFRDHGWGFGMSVLIKGNDTEGSAGRYGWDGGLGTSWSSHPREGLITILFTNRSWVSPEPPPLFREFWALSHGTAEG